MRFVCENCQTRYIIPDERARGRVLRIRCKKCGNLIVVNAEASDELAPQAEASTPSVRDELTQMIDTHPLGAAEAPPPGSSSDPPPISGDAEWHVIIQGRQLGPWPLSQLVERMAAGEVTPRTYVWREGQGDWKRAEDLRDLSRWFPAKPPPPVQDAPLASPRSPPPGQLGQLASTSTPAKASNAAEPQRVDELHEQFFSGAELTDVPTDQRGFAGLGQIADALEFEAPKAGEVTKFFITQAGVHRARSPWRIAAFAFGGVLLLCAAVVGLSRLGVTVPLMPERSAGPGQTVFSGGSRDSRMQELLYGKPKPAPIRIPSVSRPVSAPDPVGTPPLARKAESHVDPLAKSDKDQLSQLYASQSLGDLKLKPSTSSAPAIDRTDAPLTPDQVAKTVSRFHSGYAGCIDRELKRNPAFQGGKVRILTTIMSSGLVRQAQIESDDARLQRAVAGGPLGLCLVDQTRRMVFPSFLGEPFDAEIPLVVGSSF